MKDIVGSVKVIPGLSLNSATGNFRTVHQTIA